MSFFDKKILILVLMTASCCFPILVHAELSPKKVLDSVYREYDKKHSCWLTLNDEQRYCMKIDRTDKIASDTGPRLYVLMAGEAVDDQGEPNGGHATSGLVGAFIVEERHGQPEIIASNPNIQMGSFGSAPTGWKLIKLGPSDYWGWQNTDGFTNHGYTNIYCSILAPYGKKIRELAGFPEGFSDEGACITKRCTSIDSKIEVDSTRNNEKVFPLRVTVTGKDKGRKLVPKTWTLLFDTTKWSYVEPKTWPLTGLTDR